jgi:Cytochrome c7 and related cytochrome c
MGKIFEGAGHLIRLALVAVALIFVFFAIRYAVVPRDFGKYGHYRAGSLDEIAARTPVFAGRAACAACHEDIVTAKSKGPHINVGCEACHGPLGRHAVDFSSQKPVLPDTAKLCVTCHEADRAKPKTFPQVVSREHAGDTACGVCHNPHQPKM